MSGVDPGASKAKCCPCGNPLAWSDQGGMCADCRDAALLKTMRRRKPMIVVEEESPTASSQDKRDGNYRLESPDRKELSP